MTNCIHDHGRWGKGDQLGAGHFLTPERTLAALRMVKDGTIVDMSHVIEIGAPRMAPNQSPYHIQAGPTSAGSIRRRRAMGAKNDAGSNLERIEMTTHVGTHIDALGHFSKGDMLYGGYSASETVDDFGLANLGIEHMPPMVTRGILLDVSRLDGGEYLESGRAVTAGDLEKALSAAKLTIQPGDVRDRLTREIYVSRDVNDPTGLLEVTMEKVVAAEEAERKLDRAVRSGEVVGLDRAIELVDLLPRRLDVQAVRQHVDRTAE